MKGLLVRVGADTSSGRWNGPVDSRSREFVYIPIPEIKPCIPKLATSYDMVTPHLGGRWPCLPGRLAGSNTHLDPDFDHLTYGDWRQRASQIRNNLDSGDLLVFYSGLRDVNPAPRLVYAIIGLYIIKEIVLAESVPKRDWHKNAHTRRQSQSDGDIVVSARRKVSGRLTHCLPIGEYGPPIEQPEKGSSYRIQRELFEMWGGLTTDYLQRSARLPEFCDADRFYRWFKQQGVSLVARNN